MRGKQSRKKKTMKTTSQKKANRLPQESKQSQQAAPQADGQTGTVKPDNRLPIDAEARKKNRTLPTEKVLNLLLNSQPELYRLAEVVGKWVWVTFKEQPAAELRQQLAQLGFHWNRERQAWQHPCGQFRLRGFQDPHEKYSSYYPADQQAA
jgi:muconolactone delta-isomerase